MQITRFRQFRREFTPDRQRVHAGSETIRVVRVVRVVSVARPAQKLSLIGNRTSKSRRICQIVIVSHWGPATGIAACSRDCGLHLGMRPAPGIAACTGHCGLRLGLRPTTGIAATSGDCGLQRGLGKATGGSHQPAAVTARSSWESASAVAPGPAGVAGRTSATDVHFFPRARFAAKNSVSTPTALSQLAHLSVTSQR